MANINVKFKVKNEDVDEFLIGFLKARPVPTDTNGSPLYAEENPVIEEIGIEEI